MSMSNSNSIIYTCNSTNTNAYNYNYSDNIVVNCGFRMQLMLTCSEKNKPSV